MRNAIVALATVVVVVTAFSPPASAQLARCDTVAFTACGGELSGTAWTYGEVLCLDFPPISTLFPGCTGGSVQIEGTMEGSTTFAADGTYTDDHRPTMAITMSIPLTCLPAGATCEALAGRPGSTVTPTETDCIVVVTQSEPEVETGTYTVEGSTATLTEPDGDIDVGHFCVEGDVLTVEMINPEDPGMRAIVRFNRQI